MSFLNKMTFHNMKRAVASTTSSANEHTTEASDPAFEAALADFSRYHTSIVTLDTSLSEYARLYFSFFTSSSDIIHNMSNAITNEDPAALRNTFASTRDSHAALTSAPEKAIADLLRETCIRPINDELQAHKKLLTLIDQRHELARDLDYYSTKLHSLQEEKAKQELKGKWTPGEQEKLDRNQTKRDQANTVFVTVNADVVAQLHSTTERKGELLMAVFGAFETVERRVAELYLSAVSAPITVAPSSTGQGSTIESRSGDMSKPTVPTSALSGPAVSLGLEGEVAGGPKIIMTPATPPPSYAPAPYDPSKGTTPGRVSPQQQPQPPPPPPPPPHPHLPH